MAPAFVLDLRARLLDWFGREKRALPWRESRDPYRVWISESMLQQTRVETVIPYYRRFLERFPTLAALAEAPIDDVLAHWSGLGYYRRARTLHAAAQAIVARHGGVFPRSRAELLALPGIGPYTSGAIASIAFDSREPLVDGNVARVFARIFALDLPQESAAFQADVWTRAETLVKAGNRAGAWNQALMELGATVCTPRDPRCDPCPIRDLCRARAEDRVEDLPRAKVRKSAVDVDLLALVVVDRERLLLERRPESGRMAGLWQLPTIETSGGELLAPRAWSASLELAEIEPLGAVRHTITHHRIRARVSTGRIVVGELSETIRWVARSKVETELALTGMTKKILKKGLLDAAPSLKSPRAHGI
jgi:A/G-specific adenine glycosylase